MAYSLTTSFTQPSARSIVSPKTHTPLSRLQERGHRFHAPALGRWINRDPIGERGGLSLFRFVDNNSISKLDHLGLLALSISPSGPYPRDCGAFDYIRKWLGGGVEILQRIDVWVLVFDCEGNLEDTELNLFWEHFNAGTIDSWSRTYSDPENGKCTQGYGYVSGHALLYDSDVINDPPQAPWILTDPDPNHPANGRPHVDIPPATGSVPPGLPSGTTPAAPPYSETLFFSWNCCDGVKQTEFTSSPSGGWSSDGCCEDE